MRTALCTHLKLCWGVSLAIACLASGCIGTRWSRPPLHIAVVDARTQEPVGDVEIEIDPQTRVVSDHEGKAEVAGVSYNELTLPGNEAPRTHVTVKATKAGYCSARLVKSSGFGGAGSEPWNVIIELSDAPCPVASRGRR